MNNSAMVLIKSNSPNLNRVIPEWWPIMIGMLFLYLPTFYDLFNGLWSTEEQMHGPVILALSLWLIYRKFPLTFGLNPGNSSFVMGWAIFLTGMMFYIVGRSQQIMQFEIGSFIWIIAAILLIKRGVGALKVMLFPLFFMLFMVPLPGTVVIMLTMPMKMAVSYVAENILFFANYPIARNGVILQIGQYQLLVADACAGMQTLFTLEALGLFYLNVVKHTSVFRNVVLAILIVPISFIANVIRVTTLTLITYYLGDEAGQGFLHGFAGMVLFLSALILILCIDALLRIIIKSRSTDTASPA